MKKYLSPFLISTFLLPASHLVAQEGMVCTGGRTAQEQCDYFFEQREYDIFLDPFGYRQFQCAKDLEGVPLGELENINVGERCLARANMMSVLSDYNRRECKVLNFCL
jgi:hypothetical protein